ncbi:MAG: hypothetical protein AAGC60_00285 [Acidobacteriota bacterium]
MSFTWTSADGVQELAQGGPEPWTGLQAGAPSAPEALALWYRRGESTGEPVRDLLLVAEVQDPQGRWVRSGVPALDQQWIELRVTDQIADARPEQRRLRSEWTPVGAGRALRLADVYPGDARLIERRLRAPSSQQGQHLPIRLVVLYDEHTIPLPGPPARRGIVPVYGDAAQTAIVRSKLRVFANGGASLSIPPRIAVHQGTARGFPWHDEPLDQADGAAEPLAAGEHYLALLSQAPGGVTLTKGLRAATPAVPAWPDDEIPLALVRVHHQPGGVSQVVEADVDDWMLREHLEAAWDTGETTLHLDAGEALGAETRRVWSRRVPLPLAPETTSTVWQLDSGLYDVTDGAPPTPGALALYRATTDALGVVDVVDLRPWAGETLHLRIAAAPPGAPGPLGAPAVVPEAGYTLDRIVLAAADSGAGAGETVVEVDLDGVSLFPSAASFDERPRITPGGATLHRDAWPEGLLSLEPGQRLSARTVAHADTPPSHLELVLILRRR